MPYNVISLPLSDTFRAVQREFERHMAPTTDHHTGFSVAETDTAFLVRLDLPGVPADSIDITVEKGVLTIVAERPSTTAEGAKVLFSNTPQGVIRKSRQLHDSIDPKSVDAVLENGVLKISMTRKPELQPRKVSVRAANS
jgi:HSP20 family protein